MNEIENLKDKIVELQNKLVKLESKNRDFEDAQNQNYRKHLSKAMALMNASSNSLIELDEQYNIIFLNKEAKQLLEISSNEYKGKKINEYFEPDVIVDLIATVSVVIQNKQNDISVFYYQEQYFKVSTNLIDNNSEITVLLIISNITEQTANIKDLKYKSILLEKALDESSASLVVFDITKNKLINFNSTTLKLFDLDSNSNSDEVFDFINKSRVYRHNNDSIESIYKTLKEKGKYTGEFEFITKTGKSFIASYKATIIDIDKGTIVFARIEDVTEAKKIKQKELIDKQKYQQQIEQSPLGYIEWNANLEVVEWNSSAEEIFGYEKKDVLGKYASFIIHPQERKFTEVYWQGVIENEKGSHSTQANINKQNKVINIEWYNTPLFDENGKLLGICSIVNNITKKIDAENKLKYQSELLESIFEEAIDGILLFKDKSAEVVAFNKRALEIFEVKNLEELNIHMLNSRKIKWTKKDWDEYNSMLESVGYYEKETEFITKNGNSIWITNFAKRININGNYFELLRITDVSELKKINLKLNLESQKQRIHFEQSHLGYIEWDTNFKVAEWNPIAEKIFGYKRHEALGMHATSILPENEKQNAEHIWQKMLAYKRGNREVYNNITKDSQIVQLEWFDTPLYDETGNVLGVSSLINDVTDKLKTDEELKYKSAILETIYDESIDGIMLFKKNSFEIISCNKRTLEIFEATSLTQLNSFYPSARIIKQSKNERDQIFQNILHGTIFNNDIEFITCTGNNIWLSVVVKLISFNDKQLELVRVTDVSELKKINAKFNLERQKQSIHLEHSPLGYIEWNKDFEVVEWNPSAERIFGFKKEEVLGKHSSFIIPTSEENLVKNVWENLKKNTGGFKSKNKNLTKNNELITAEWYNTPLFNEQNEFVGICCLIDNVTEQMEAQKTLERNLKEKDLMLSEIHHRVKNNLAIISGLLFMHSETIADENLRQILKESQSRIKLMAIIHEQLYETENFGNINVHTYFNELVKKISSSFYNDKKIIDVEILVDDFTLPISKALIIGLVINELLINAYKYAFTNVDKGKVKISFIKNTHYYLTVSDNGIGYSENFNIEKSSKLGLTLVKTLTNQLDCDILFENKNGAYCTLILKKL